VTRRRSWTVALTLGVGLALVLAEAGLRVSGQFEPPPQVLKPLRPEFNRPDPELGYTLKPSLRTTFRYPPTSTRDLDLVRIATGSGTAASSTSRIRGRGCGCSAIR
jgi:hypothetical protein